MLETHTQKPLRLWTILLFSILIGLMATLWGYRFGIGNQIEQLPIVLRAINHSFLVNDFFTNATQDFISRAFFANFIAGLAHLAPLATVYLLLTILGNVGITFVTALFSRELFDGSDLAGLVAAGAIMTLKTFWLGYSNIIYDTFLEPAHLAMPFLLLSIWAGLRQRPVACVLTAGMASLFHPLMGLETGALMLAVIGVTSIRHRLTSRSKNDSIPGRNLWIRLGIGGVLYIGVAALILIPYMSAKQIPASQFIQIVAFFRHPHHYVPSSFDTWQYLQALVFLLPVGIAWYYGKQGATRLKSLPFQISVLLGFLVLLCLGGYLFVEVFPTRLWTIAQTFRLLFMVKWLGLVIITGWVGYQIQINSENGVSPFVLLASLLSQVTLFISFVAHLVRDWSKRHLPMLNPVLAGGPLLVLILPLLLVFPPEDRIFILFPLFSLMAMSLFYGRGGWLVNGLNVVVTAVVVVVLLVGGKFLPNTVMAFFDSPVITLSQLSGNDADLARFAKANTPPDAIFLTPPTLGGFRYLAERAIVVDFDAFPFSDQAMVEWEQRIFDCYGIPTRMGFDAGPEMKDHYRAVSKADLLVLQEKYHFTYVVLYIETATDLPVLYQNKTYKLVAIQSGVK